MVQSKCIPRLGGVYPKDRSLPLYKEYNNERYTLTLHLILALFFLIVFETLY